MYFTQNKGGDKIRLDSGAFIKYPKEIIDISSQLPYMIPIYGYLYIKRGLDDSIETCYKWLADFIRVEPNTKSGRNVEVFRLCIEWLHGSGYIKDVVDNLDNISIIDKISIMLNPTRVDTCETFALVYWNELIQILNNFKIGCGVSREAVLRTFLYIRYNMSRRKPGDTIQARPEIYYNTYKWLGAILGSDRRVISNVDKFLNQIGVLYSEELPHYKNEKGEWRTRDHIFVNKYEYQKEDVENNKSHIPGWKQELAWGKKQLLNKGDKK